MVEQRIVFFAEGSKSMRGLLGGKGAGLAEMTKIGLPVPPGFVITTTASREYYERGGIPDELLAEVESSLTRLETMTGKVFGNPDNPLLLSIRSGAEFSMPGMMDTILNLGMNPWVVSGLADLTNPRFAYDCYRRLIEKYSEIVLRVPSYEFSDALNSLKVREGVRADHELSTNALMKLQERYLEIVRTNTGAEFPTDPRQQLVGAIKAVFDSWMNDRARLYRRINDIPEYLGTAVNVQSMVYGNMGLTSGTGVCFTRNPSTGERELFGEFLQNAQGEDVVAGVRTPRSVSYLEELMPEVYDELIDVAGSLEKHYRDMQDIEFTVEDGKLYMLQTRTGKRSGAASVAIAMSMLEESLISPAEAVARVSPEQIEQMLHRGVDYSQDWPRLCRGLPASPGAACGSIVFDSETAVRYSRTGRKTILVRPETSPDDIQGIVVSEGIVTSRGGMTSHAAVVARGMGKPCVCGADDLRIDLNVKSVSVGGVVLTEGDTISIDGSQGLVFHGEVPLTEPQLHDDFWRLLQLADSQARLGVRANADTPQDARLARSFGATGIGLCRTEHMFMDGERLTVMQAMIMAESDEYRQDSLAKLLPMQRGDFYGILKEMDSLPVTIRLLDPPLHEFLPDREALLKASAESTSHGAKVRAERALRKLDTLHEANPMLGHRGCRLGITTPGIYAMQVEAIAEATFDLLAEGLSPCPEIMIPLIGHHRELITLRRLVESTWEAVQRRRGNQYRVPIGTMIELPRACLVGGDLAKHAEFFSFGTNDLTQTTFGFSRDDAEGKFLSHYLSADILDDNPFAVLDTQGVGRLMKLAFAEGREANPSLKVGICGEHGGEPKSIAFCNEMGINYVSCSPFRVPVARLAAGRAARTQAQEDK